MKLFNILDNCSTEYNLLNPENILIKEITTNSKNVKKNFIFTAVKGANHDGEKFIKKILHIKNIVLLLEKDSNFLCEYSKNNHKKLTIIISKDHISLTNEIAANLFPNNINEKIAVTGTNGKTSVCEYTRNLWEIKKSVCASVGTLGTIFRNKTIAKPSLTTPISENLHKILNKISKENCTNLVMEASSIGIDKKRLYPIKFDKIAFTNLSRDHLDYHKSLKNYKKSKKKLFEENSKKESIAILNSDDKESTFFYDACQKKKLRILDYGKKAKYLKIKSIIKKEDHHKVDFTLKNKNCSVKIKCHSTFEIYNLFCSLILVFDNKLTNKHFNLLNKLKNPKGRIEKIYDKNFKIFIDYAHTPDALKNVLKALNEEKKNRLIAVIGCGGDRDHGKRKIMTKQALKYSDLIILADDNPRNENPKKIRLEMQENLNNNQKKKIIDIGDRTKAIQFAIKSLKTNDILLIAGKGHESYQIIKNKKKYFSDHDTVLNLLK